MFKRSFKSKKRFETVRECLEYQIKEQKLARCCYDFNEEGNCAYYLHESTRGHIVEPSDMLRIAEKFFNEFGWVHFEGWGEAGDGYVTCYKAEEKEKDFIKRRVEDHNKRVREKINKCNEMLRNGVSKEEVLDYYHKAPKEWEEPLDDDEGEK